MLKCCLVRCMNCVYSAGRNFLVLYCYCYFNKLFLELTRKFLFLQEPCVSLHLLLSNQKNCCNFRLLIIGDLRRANVYEPRVLLEGVSIVFEVLIVNDDVTLDFVFLIIESSLKFIASGNGKTVLHESRMILQSNFILNYTVKFYYVKILN